MRSRTLGVVLLAALGISACGAPVRGSTAPVPEALAGASSDDPSDPPRTLEEAEAALERARAELSAVPLEGAPEGSSAGAAPAQAAPPSQPSAPPGDVHEADEATPQSEARYEESRDRGPALTPCAAACKAFGSLTRAKDAVCRLEEPPGPRCERARGIARDAEARVRGCACLP